MNTLIIGTLKKFLVERGVLEEFCEAFTKGDYEASYVRIINSFTWADARKRQGNNIPWTHIDDMWSDLFRRSKFMNSNVSTEERHEIVQYLLRSNTNIMLKHISRIRDDI